MANYYIEASYVYTSLVILLIYVYINTSLVYMEYTAQGKSYVASTAI